MNPIERLNEWLQSRRDDRAARLASREYTDIVTLSRKGVLRAKGTGQSITQIRAAITSRVRVPVKVLVPHGTYFVASGAHQNMVTRQEYRFDLGAMDTRHISVPASCINANLAIPRESDAFRGVAKVSKNLSRFLEAAQGEDPMTVQAGVWAITDGYTGAQVQQHLRIRRSSARGAIGGLRSPLDQFGSDGGSAVSDSNIRRAREILRGLGIRTNL
jgi:hypothetical protein